MKIGIIDADLLDNGTRHPNLALMKISGFHKDEGHSVSLLDNYEDLNYYDKVYISKVFSYTSVPEGITSLQNVVIGGTGFFEDGGENLPDEIEHHMPDYDLYTNFVNAQIKKGRKRGFVSDYLDYSIGFTTRGCFRKCSFCVNKKYDRAFIHSPVKEFYDSTRPYIYLWDDNFLAYSGWEAVLDDIESTGRPFQFRQGLDIRLMTHRKAKRLANARYHGDFIFAFDHIEEKELIIKKLEIWKRYCAKTTKLYVLCAYNSQDEQDIEDTFERISILMKYGCLPYIMRYDSYKDSPWKSLYVQIARWCNQPQFFKKKSFRQFCEANQYYHKNKETTCSAYQSMIDFEGTFPEIAKKYFDLRFDEENKYGVNYGFGRRYAHKQSCNPCAEQQKSWQDAYQGVMSLEETLARYFQKEMDLQCLIYPEINCVRYPKEVLAGWFCSKLLGMTISDIFEIICRNEGSEEVLPYNIPQFSSFTDAYIETPKILDFSGHSMSYREIGVYLDNGKEKNEIAQRKYGENHSKMAALLDLVAITKPNGSYMVDLSVLGKAFNRRNDCEKKRLAVRLLLRIPIIQKMLIQALSSEINLEAELCCLAKQTKKRRKPNIALLLKLIYDDISEDEKKIKSAIDNIRR